MVEGHVGEDEIMFVDVGWGFGFGDEDLGDVWGCFYEAFCGFVLTKVVIKGLAPGNEALNSTPNQFTITGHFSGEVLIRLDLDNPFNGLEGHRDFTVRGM